MQGPYYNQDLSYAQGVRYRVNYGSPKWDYYTDASLKLSTYRERSFASDGHLPTTWFARKASFAGVYFTMQYEGHPSYESWSRRLGVAPKYPWLFTTPWMNWWDQSELTNTKPNIDSSGLAEANDKMYGRIATTQYGYGEELAELTESVSYVTGTALKLGRVLRDVRKGKFSSFVRRATRTPTSKVPVRERALAISRDRARKKRRANRPPSRKDWKKLRPDDRWLELQFAVTPLIGSVSTALDLYKKGIEYSTPIVTYEGKADHYHPFAQYLTGTMNGEKITRSGGSSVVHRVKSAFRIDDPGLVAIKELGLSNPLEWAWAVVPFSFVADWVLPIGKALSLMTALIGQTFLWCTESISVKASLALNLLADQYSTRYYLDDEYYTVIAYNRRTRQSLPIWTPRIKSPFSWWKGVTAGALLTSIKL